MSTIILNVLKQIPVPIFGSASYAAQFAARKSNLLPRLAPWGVPLGAGALWFVWPAVDEEWKGEMGLVAPAVVETVKIEEPVYRMSATERKVVEAMKGGDYSYLENDWEAFQKRASNPNDDDDDDDEDDEDGDEDGDDGDDDGGDDLAAAADEDDDEEEDGEVDAVAEAAKAARISAEEERVLDNIRKGDFSSLEADWDAFQIKASNPNEDDDDDDEDEEEDGDEEEEEEGGADGEEEGADEEEE